jgi:hypothetical protein
VVPWIKLGAEPEISLVIELTIVLYLNLSDIVDTLLLGEMPAELHPVPKTPS